jgi:hypothetical protein
LIREEFSFLFNSVKTNSKENDPGEFMLNRDPGKYAGKVRYSNYFVSVSSVTYNDSKEIP